MATEKDTIREIGVQSNLSTRALNILMRKEFKSIYDLVEYYKKHGNFLSIRNCGDSSSKELIELSKKYINGSTNHVPMASEKDELRKIGLQSNLSTRTFNILISRDFESIYDLVDYYKRNGDFLSIDGCGMKSNRELIELAEKYIHKGMNHVANKIEEVEPASPTIERLFILQFKILFKRLSTDVKQFVKSKIGVNYQFNDIVELSKTKFDDQEIKKSTLSEITSFVFDYTSKFDELHKYNSSIEVEREVFKTIFHGLNIWDVELEHLFNEIKRDYDYYPVFKIVDHIIKSGKFFKKYEGYIFEHYLKYFKKKQHNDSLEEVGTELGITRERVRQIRNGLFKKFSNQFHFISFLSLFVDLHQAYGIDVSESYIYLTDQRVDNINRTEKTNFSKLFMSKVIIALTDGKFMLCGYEMNYHTTHQKRKRLSLKEPYLISKFLDNYFDLKTFVNDIEKRHEDGIKDTYTLNLKAYISRFCKEIDLEKLAALEKLCGIIVFNEFDMIVNYKDELVFERNKKKLSYELALEAIEKMGFNENGYHINQISDKINELYPDIDYSNNIESLRSAINNHKSIFIYFGRNSTYGLKSWEENFDNVKGGTIRDIVQEFLLDKESPQHIAVILEYVNQFRNTNEDNIIGNLKLDESKTFTIYDGRFIGLKKKKYAEKDVEFVSAQGSIFTSESLKKYLPDKFEDVVQKICSEHNLRSIQVSSILNKQIKNKLLNINNNEILSINHG
jgi:transcriptional regulator with XRE-family HTH domain